MYEEILMKFSEELEPYSFQSNIKQMLTISGTDQKLLNRVKEINSRMTRIVFEKELEMCKDDKEKYIMSEYRVIKIIYGVGHPRIGQIIDDIIETYNKEGGYLCYSQKRRLQKYFNKTEQYKRGYQMFMKMFLKDFNYRILGNQL